MSRHLISTPVKAEPCPRCRAATLRGISEGLTTTVDATPLDRAGEIAALIDGKWTYTLNQRNELVHRTDWRIKSTMLAGTIHARHVCQPIQPEPTQLQLEFDIPAA